MMARNRPPAMGHHHTDPQPAGVASLEQHARRSLAANHARRCRASTPPVDALGARGAVLRTRNQRPDAADAPLDQRWLGSRTVAPRRAEPASLGPSRLGAAHRQLGHLSRRGGRHRPADPRGCHHQTHAHRRGQGMEEPRGHLVAGLTQCLGRRDPRQLGARRQGRGCLHSTWPSFSLDRHLIIMPHAIAIASDDRWWWQPSFTASSSSLPQTMSQLWAPSKTAPFMQSIPLLEYENGREFYVLLEDNESQLVDELPDTHRVRKVRVGEGLHGWMRLCVSSTLIDDEDDAATAAPTSAAAAAVSPFAQLASVLQLALVPPRHQPSTCTTSSSVVPPSTTSS